MQLRRTALLLPALRAGSYGTWSDPLLVTMRTWACDRQHSITTPLLLCGSAPSRKPRARPPVKYGNAEVLSPRGRSLSYRTRCSSTGNYGHLLHPLPLRV